MEGIHPVNDPKAEQDLKHLREAVEHACNLLEGPAHACQGIVLEAFLSLSKAINRKGPDKSDSVPREWTDYVGE